MSTVLIMMACSAAKLDHAAPATELYQGVMFQTLRAHLPAGEDQPCVVILSAEHGLVCDNDEIEPYEREMTKERSDELVSAGYPDDFYFDGDPFEQIILAGGELYRRVMRVYIETMREFGAVAPGAVVIETCGGIGEQRHQLGAFLAACATDETTVRAAA